MKNRYFYLFILIFTFNKCNFAKTSYFPEIYIFDGTAEIELSYYKDMQVCLNVGYVSQMHFPYFEPTFDFISEKFIKSHHIMKVGIKFSIGSDFWIWNKRMQNIEIDINYLYKLFDYRANGIEYTNKNMNISILFWSEVFGFGIDFSYLHYDSFYFGLKFGLKKKFLYGNFSVCGAINKRFIKLNNINDNDELNSHNKVLIKEITNDYDPMNVLSISNLSKITTSVKGNAEIIINSMPYYYLIDDAIIEFVQENVSVSFVNNLTLKNIYDIINSLYQNIQVTDVKDLDPKCFEKQIDILINNEKNKMVNNEFFCNKFRFCQIDNSKIAELFESLNCSKIAIENAMQDFNVDKGSLLDELKDLNNIKLDYINDCSFNENIENFTKKSSNNIDYLFVKNLIKCCLEDDLINDVFTNEISQNNEFIQILNNAKCEKNINEQKIKYIKAVNYYINAKYENDSNNDIKNELNELVRKFYDNENEIYKRNNEIQELELKYNEKINKLKKEYKEIFYKKRKYELVKKYNDEIIRYFTNKRAEKDRRKKENQENISNGKDKGFIRNLFSSKSKTAKQAESKNTVNENKKHDWNIDTYKQEKVIECILKMYDLNENDERTKFVLNNLKEYVNIETILEDHKNKKQEGKTIDIIYRITSKIKEYFSS